MEDPTASEGLARLERNLRALARAGSDLAERLCWPARSSHVERASDGSWLRKGLRFSVQSGELALDPGPVRGHVLVGVGLGEQVDALLASPEAGSVLAWERDPWLLRMALAHCDWSDALAQGRLVLGLGSDLVEWLERDPDLRPRLHPRLGALYRLESALFGRDVTGPRIAVGLDQLLVDEVAAALAKEGYVACPFDLDAWSLEELSRAVERTRVQGVLSINYVPDLVEFCRARDLAYVCWEIDPTTEGPPRPQRLTRHCAVWTYRASHVEAFRRAGFERVAHLPLASDPDKRCPPQGQPPAGLGEIGLAFVGSSLAPEAERARRLLLDAYARRHPDEPGARAEGERRLARLLERPACDAPPPSGPLPGPVCEEPADLLGDLRDAGLREDPVALLDQLIAAETRRRRVASLHGFGIDVWGDPGWAAIEREGVRYRGYAGHHHELTWIYARAAINLDVGRAYQPDIVTLRVFDVLACGGFVLAERSRDLEELFEIGHEVEAYADASELHEKVAYYLAHPAARRAIAERGRHAVRTRHSVRERVRRMLAAFPPAPRRSSDIDR